MADESLGASASSSSSSSSALDPPGTAGSMLGSTAGSVAGGGGTAAGASKAQTAGALRKSIRAKRKETDLRRMLHSYDLTTAPPERVKRLAQVFDDIGTRSSCPTHLIYSPKPVPRGKHKNRVPISKSTVSTSAAGSMLASKDFAKDRAAYELKLEKERRDFAEKIERTRDAIETDLEDIDFLKQQMLAQKERIAAHQNAPRAQEREAEAGMILPVTGYNNASVLNKRMVEKSLMQLTKRIMQKRAEGNDAIGDNMKIKYVIDNLRRERHTFIKIFRNMNEELTEIKRQVADDEEFIETANGDRADLHTEIRNAQHTRDEMRADAERDLAELEQKRLDEERLEKLAREAEDEKRRKERNQKRADVKAARNRAREEHQKKHVAHMAASKTSGLLGGDSVESGGSAILASQGLPGGGGVESSIMDGSSTLDSLSAITASMGDAAGGKGAADRGREGMEEIFDEWQNLWGKLLEGTLHRKQRGSSNARGDGGAGGKTSNKDGTGEVSSNPRRGSTRPKPMNGYGSGNAPPSPGGAAAEETHLRTKLVDELRANADANFSQMQLLNDLRNKRHALSNNIRDLQVEVRQLERARSDAGGADDGTGTVKLIKRLEQEVQQLQRVVLQESQVYSSKLRAVDSFCDEITTCYLRTGAGGGGDGGGDGDGEGDGDGDGDGDGGGEADGDADGGNGAGSPNGGRRRSSFDGSDNGAGEEGGSPGMGDTGNNGSGPMSESTSGDTIPKLKPHNMRALDNLKVIEQHVKNVIRQYAAQAMTIGQPGPGGQNTSLASSANLLSSPHGHTGTINYSRLSPKEREAIIAKRIGQVSATTAARSVDQRIPRVDVPDDMEGAFGFDPDGLDEKPLLVHEVSEQLQMQLAKIKEESSLRMSMSSALGSSGTPQQSAVSSTGLIDKASRLRAEKEAMYERVAIQAIAEQQRHHEAARRLEEMQTKSMEAQRDKAKKHSQSSKRFKGKLSVRSVEIV